MDHQHALHRLRSKPLLSRALDYAIFDRLNGDHFYDPIEIEYAKDNREELLQELVEELQDPRTYSPREGFAYFPPKNALCDRRFVYIPIKDLIVRYAIAILFAEEIEHEIHPQCFANRRSVNVAESHRFTEDFATGGWARFCAWQREQCDRHSILLRTDISAFYDSISHEYLLDTVSKHLALHSSCPLLELFGRLLQIPVIYYSPSNGEIEGPAVMKQSLPIGDGVEGYLANLFLKDVDDAMSTVNASYGRYVDDIRLFGETRQDVMHKLRILQEQLLRKGLNMNSNKTEIAEDEPALKNLISQFSDIGGYQYEEDGAADSTLSSHIDQPFESFSRTFSQTDVISSAGDAKDFCKYLGASDSSGSPILRIEERRTWHLDRIKIIIHQWRSSGRHASWLLVQTACYAGVTDQTKHRATELMLELLDDVNVSPYVRYRILHHLAKPRRKTDGSSFYFIDQLSQQRREHIRRLLPGFIASPAFELNLIALHMLRIIGADHSEIREIVKANAKTHCSPLRAALNTIFRSEPPQANDRPFEIGPDEVPELY